MDRVRVIAGPLCFLAQTRMAGLDSREIRLIARHGRVEIWIQRGTDDPTKGFLSHAVYLPPGADINKVRAWRRGESLFIRAQRASYAQEITSAK